MPKVVIKHELRLGRIRFPGIVAQGELRINGGRLRAKLMVFDTPKTLNRFWVDYLGKGKLGQRCLGAVNSLAYYVESFPPLPGTPKKRIEVDRRYFCIIGLCREHLTIRVISHEAVHAAYAFAERKARSWWDAQARHNDEESIAYPVGELSAHMVNFLLAHKLLEGGRIST